MLPDLTFPQLKFGDKEIPWDLRTLLYRGGAATDSTKVAVRIRNGDLGQPILDRLPLVLRIHEYVGYLIAAGRARQGIASNFRQIRYFIGFIDKLNLEINIENLQERYLDWTSALQHRVRIDKDLKHESAYHMAAHAGTIIDAVLERESPIIRLAQFRKTRKRPLASSKQDLEEAFKFGAYLHDLSIGLSTNVVLGSLPVRIKLRTGQMIEKWGPLRPVKNRAKAETIEIHNAIASTKTRSTIVNLKIEAESLIFVANTSMNWAQVLQVKRGDFSYASYKDGYKVRRRRKARKQGEVEFEIFREYRSHLDGYLKWLQIMFPNEPNGLLFPFIESGQVHSQKRPIKQVNELCRSLGIRFVPPKLLRNTRLNFLARQTNDISITAQMGQHSEDTFEKSYLRPNHQTALSEIHRFHLKTDPTFASPGPGVCIAYEPEIFQGSPPNAPTPDCINPSGCMFCSKQRDQDSFDFVWSIASLRHLKLIEVSRTRTEQLINSTEKTPVELEIEILTQKLAFFENSNSKRKTWKREALERVWEANYHPMWDGFIQIAEQST